MRYKLEFIHVDEDGNCDDSADYDVTYYDTALEAWQAMMHGISNVWNPWDNITGFGSNPEYETVVKIHSTGAVVHFDDGTEDEYVIREVND